MNLILQHWGSPDLPPVVEQSVDNIRSYAGRIGAEYRLLQGKPFDPDLGWEMQKLMVLMPWDKYDQVAMVDSDMFAVPGLTENLFSYRGVGIPQKKTKKHLIGLIPELIHHEYPLFGGSIVKLPRLYRDILRVGIPAASLEVFDQKRKFGQDESSMHRLMALASVKLPALNCKWSVSSWANNVSSAFMVHVRRKFSKRKRRDKIINLQDLQQKGIL